MIDGTELAAIFATLNKSAQTVREILQTLVDLPETGKD
jgi:hypothetical protein